MNTTLQDLEKMISTVKDAMESLPKIDKPKKNFFQITGTSRKELINSRMLYYYFNKNEEHGFGSLFMDSLITLMGENETINSEVDYKVTREKDNLDLLITYQNDESETEEIFPDDSEGKRRMQYAGYDWAIIIENKIYHHLHNDLAKYCNRVYVNPYGQKIGVVISPWGIIGKEKTFSIQANREQPIVFHNIKHKDLTDKVKEKLPDYQDGADAADLLLLNQYIINIESLYQNPIHQKMEEKKLEFYQNHTETINELVAIKSAARRLVVKQTREVMEELGYKGGAKGEDIQQEHFILIDKKNTRNYFKIFIWYPSITNGKLHLYFELRAAYVQYGAEMHKNDEFTKLINSQGANKLGRAQKSGKHYYQLAVVDKCDIRVKEEGETFKSNLKSALEIILLKEETGFAAKCGFILEKIINKNNNNPT